MNDQQSDHGPVNEDVRIDALDERLKAAKQREASRTGNEQQGQDENARLGNRVLADLLGGLIGGAVIGWTFDWFFQTLPWGLLAGLFLGIAVAFRNIIRISNRRP